MNNGFLSPDWLYAFQEHSPGNSILYQVLRRLIKEERHSFQFADRGLTSHITFGAQNFSLSPLYCQMREDPVLAGCRWGADGGGRRWTFSWVWFGLLFFCCCFVFNVSQTSPPNLLLLLSPLSTMAHSQD